MLSPHALLRSRRCLSKYLNDNRCRQVVKLLYGAGLRLLEALMLRVKRH